LRDAVSLRVSLLPLVGVIPPFLFLWWAERFERRVLEPSPQWRYRVLAAGGFSAVPVLFVGITLSAPLSYLSDPLLSLYEAFILASLVEEGFKLLCIALLTRGALAPRTRYGAFLYALHATMGFAVVENVIALLSAADIETLTRRFMLRACLSVPMHFATGGVLGFMTAKGKFDRDSLGWPTGLALAVFFHGAFDAALFGMDRLPEGMEGARTACATIALALPILGLAALVRFARRLRALDNAQGRPAVAERDSPAKSAV
jgi:RsiW-degrading membrane proteinase PrsW (M82 family)